MKIFCILSSMLFMFFATSEVYSQPDRVKSGLVSQKQNLLFWKVESKKGTAYVLGSVHVGQPDFYPMHPTIEGAFNMSHQLIGELGDIPASEIQKHFNGKQMFKKGKSLKNFLSKAYLNKLKVYCDKNSMGFNSIVKLKPWLVNIIIAQQVMKQMSLDKNYGVDQYFIKKAQGKKTIIGLETAAFQAKLFYGVSFKTQLKMLKLTIDEIDTIDEKLSNLMRDWKSGNEKGLVKIILDDLKKVINSNIYENMISSRNITMANKLADILSEKKTSFVVVGAGHLVGKDSMIRILKNKGFKITSLKQ